MIARVVTLGGVLSIFDPAADDPPRSPVAFTRSFHGVFPVIIARLPGQNTFAVAEARAVFGIRKGATFGDQAQGLLPFSRQSSGNDVQQAAVWVGSGRIGARRGDSGGVGRDWRPARWRLARLGSIRLGSIRLGLIGLCLIRLGLIGLGLICLCLRSAVLRRTGRQSG